MKLISELLKLTERWDDDDYGPGNAGQICADFKFELKDGVDTSNKEEFIKKVDAAIEAANKDWPEGWDNGYDNPHIEKGRLVISAESSEDGASAEEFGEFLEKALEEFVESDVTDYDMYCESVIVTEKKKWSGKVETEWKPEEGFFTKPAKQIVKGLVAASKDLKQAMSRLNFYINRAGKNLSDEDKSRLEHAKELLSKHYEVKEGVMDVSVGGSDSAADAAYNLAKVITKQLRSELRDKGNDYNTPGIVNVAAIIGEMLQEFSGSEELQALAREVHKKLVDKEHGWEKTAGYAQTLKRLEKFIAKAD